MPQTIDADATPAELDEAGVYELEVGCDDETWGRVYADDAGRFNFSGPQKDRVEEMVRFYSEMYARHLAEFKADESDLNPHAVLAFMDARMNGRTWARVPGSVPGGPGTEMEDPDEEDDPTGNAFTDQPRDELGRWASTRGGVAKTVEDLRGELQPDPISGRLGTKAIGAVTVVGFRVGATEDKFGRGTYFSGDQEGADAYASLHPTHKTLRHEIDFDNALLAGHQNDVSREFFGKSYADMQMKLGGGVDGGRKFDVKVAKEAKKRGYDGIIYLKPAPPAKTEIAVIGRGGKPKKITANAWETRDDGRLVLNGGLVGNRSYFADCNRDKKGRCLPTGTAAEGFGTSKEMEESARIAKAKGEAAPVPPPEKVAKMREMLERAKTDPKARAGGDARGSSYARRERAQKLFAEFGGDEKGYVVCPWTGLKMHYTDDPKINPDGYPKFEQGKIFTARQGGGYQLPNLIPESFAANRSRNDQPMRKENLS